MYMEFSAAMFVGRCGCWETTSVVSVSVGVMQTVLPGEPLLKKLQSQPQTADLYWPLMFQGSGRLNTMNVSTINSTK